MDAPQEPADTAVPRSMAWLTLKFEAHMQSHVDAGLMEPSTLHQRAAAYASLRAAYGAKHTAMPRAKVVEYRDSMAATPGAADNAVKFIRALYAWAIDMGHVAENPALDIGRLNRGTGAVP